MILRDRRWFMVYGPWSMVHGLLSIIFDYASAKNQGTGETTGTGVYRDPSSPARES
jgi:hypothetical protein